MDFNQIINRNNTGSVKWDFIERHFGDGAGKLLPMWVSDFDFACPPEVQTALHQRIEHGVFGYSERDEAYFNALLHWFSSRHQLTLKQDWVCSVEGVVPGLALLVQMLTHPGDGVVVQGPYYGSFAKIITLNGRKLLENPLSESPDEGYQMDFCQLERLFRHERPPLMILCNPHNPTGRCWSANELEQLLLLCETYDVTLISDEIWADLLLPGETFTSVLHLGERWHKRVISATAASKTFGLSSLRISNFLIPDPTLRQRFLSRLDAHGLDVFNALSVQAATTAWNESRQWLDSLLDYLAENRRWFVEQAAEHLPWARIVPAQGTYLLWMDCKKLGLDDEQLKWVMADVAGIAPSMGSSFGPAGSGFIRLNLGCPRTYLEMAMDGLKRISVKSIKGAPTGG
ncbi:TPA: pyridoxal phosphate-dependent aminotransferase [Salmonella enterica subsp. salamae serovar 35:g,m,s,t:-]|uniref:cysteine-S-conjugate beta-lyase n=1 Tax=Salmonella enterica subsp. salamae TaxID=59202 RepID=A0A702KXQ8_SALER|nr:pyridoxal phosphate-dependent aminotransferase [Salmonella enterica]EAW1758710.1 pyridoxal phosphate-dependent aminotransferase [Salmonella enterica subsp. enterica]ECF5955553.1 pyridoxal phosphate-dependent aminotransferase [Salmonella enterica subsp. salamae]EKR2075204.1 pyridoxal phosphate-dependent aminotransferase [Salmonella enterica subsp. salamae serovar 9,46:l,w:e,n,x]HCA3404812.1 pyridoxal phosphate-dependent aminotransferase [Salmonella enterica subsp. salamae serovar 35:g,m,s,t:-